MTDRPDTPLTRALALAGEVIERRNTIPILSNVILSTVGDTLFVEATDLDIEIAVEVGRQSPCIESEPLNVTVPFDALRRIADARKIGAVVHHARGKNGNVLSVLTAGDAEFELPTLPVEEMPRLNKGFTAVASFTMRAGDIRETLNSVAHGISFEETRYYLNGVFMHVLAASQGYMGNLLAFAATDGHRLYRAVRPLPAGAEGLRGGVIIPRKVVHLLVKALESMPDEEVTIEVSDDTAPRLRIVTAGLTIISKTIDGTFPDYARVVPQSSRGFLTCVASELADVARAGLCILNERVTSVVISFGDDAAKAAVNTRGDGTMTAPIPGEVAGELPTKIGLNASYLADALAPFGDDRVTLGFQDAAAPVLIKREGNDTSLFVVQMPMRV